MSSEKKMHKQQTQSISTFTYVLKQNNTDLQFGDAYQESAKGTKLQVWLHIMLVNPFSNLPPLVIKSVPDFFGSTSSYRNIIINLLKYELKDFKIGCITADNFIAQVNPINPLCTQSFQHKSLTHAFKRIVLHLTSS